jgi:hypothetical protein
MHMMDVLKSISTEVFLCLKELFDYYIFTIIYFFGDKVLAVSISLFALY